VPRRRGTSRRAGGAGERRLGGARRGGYLLLGGSASRRGDDGYFADLVASDLGLDVRRIAGAAGREGLYSLRIGYAEIPRRLTDGAATPFFGVGSNMLTLPTGYPAPNTAALPLAATLQPTDLSFRYKRLDLGATVLAGPEWSYRVDVRRDRRSAHRRNEVHRAHPAAFGAEDVDVEVVADEKDFAVLAAERTAQRFENRRDRFADPLFI